MGQPPLPHISSKSLVIKQQKLLIFARGAMSSREGHNSRNGVNSEDEVEKKFDSLI